MNNWNNIVTQTEHDILLRQARMITRPLRLLAGVAIFARARAITCLTILEPKRRTICSPVVELPGTLS